MPSKLKFFKKRSFSSKLTIFLLTVLFSGYIVNISLIYLTIKRSYFREKKRELSYYLDFSCTPPTGRVEIFKDEVKIPSGFILVAMDEREGEKYCWFLRKEIVKGDILDRLYPFAIYSVWILLIGLLVFLWFSRKITSPLHEMIEEIRSSKDIMDLDFSKFFSFETKCSDFFNCEKKDCPFYEKGCISAPFDEKPCFYKATGGCRYIEDQLGRNEVAGLAFYFHSALNTLRKRTRELEKVLSMRRFLEGKYEAIFEGAVDAIFIIDPETGRIVECNKAAEELTGFSRDELLQMKYLDLRIPEEKEKDVRRYRELLKDGGEEEYIDVPIFKKDGGIVYVDIKARILSVDGKNYLVSFMRDASKRKEAEVNMVRAEKFFSLGQMASGITHEINNPLSVISMVLELVERKCDGEIAESIDKAKKSVEKISKLLKALHDFAHPGTTGFYPVDINEVVRKVADISSFEVKRGGVEFRIKLGENLPKILGVEEQIYTLLAELIMNAVHAVREVDKEKKFVEVETGYDAEKDMVYIAIRDNGVGIREDDLERIFDPFYTTKKDSSGLGLLVVQRIVYDHKGTLEVNSKVGEGTEFKVLLPTFKFKTEGK